jgi:acyl-CoA thioesterase-2
VSENRAVSPEPTPAHPDAASDPDAGTDPDGTAAENLVGLLDVLRLVPCPEQGEDTFLGQSQPQPGGRVFGGQVLAQSLVAAQRTVDPARSVHSMHGYFLRAGDSGEPITFAVERLRDGGSFSARRVHALQFGRPILSMIASFQSRSDGLEHQAPMPPAPDPESLPSLLDRYAEHADAAVLQRLRRRPIDVRHVDPPIHLEPAPASPRQAVWIRASSQLPDDPRLHEAVLAYASDLTLLEPTLRAHGISWSQPGLRAASLDHAMWWHRPARADEWLLYESESPSASGARGLNLGRIFRRDGVLVASTAQEGLLRVPPA